MKTNKHLTLSLAQDKKAIHSRDLVREFDYSPGTARSYLSYMRRQGLLERMGASYGLTQKGQDRLHFFNVSGCSDVACPLCKGKDGYLTCPRCSHQVTKRAARIRKEADFVLAVRHPGVYCDQCLGLILSESQARLMGIRTDE